jgi:hypothetical protein
MFSWFSSVPPGECRDSILKLGHDRFLPNPFQFIIIHLQSSYWKVSLNKLQTNQPTKEIQACHKVAHTGCKLRCLLVHTQHGLYLEMGCSMAQAVSHRPLTAEARVSPCGICLWWTKQQWDRLLSESFCFRLLMSFHSGSPCWEISNRPVGGRSSET